MLTLLLLPAAVAQEAPDELPPAAPATCPDGPWPGTDWLDRTAETAAARAEAVSALDAWLFPPDLDWSDTERKGVRSDGVVIVSRGAIVYERYAHGYDATTPHLAWSATKTFTNALTGIAVREGALALDDSICKHLPHLSGDACKVRVVDLLEMSSGFDWAETYEGESPTSSSVLAMLYGEGSGDMAAFVGGHPLRDEPGTTWMYSSGDSTLLAGVVGAALSPRFGERFPWPLLFGPLGVDSATWERDRTGTYVGSSYLWATPRDMARFGTLLLQDGCWDGLRLLPEGWVEASTQVTAGIRAKALDRDDGDVQGRQIWLNRSVPEAGQDTLPWPSAPDDAFAARGHWGQSITVIPSADMVVVRVADDRDGQFDFDELLAHALAIGDTP